MQISYLGEPDLNTTDSHRFQVAKTPEMLNQPLGHMK